MMTIPIITVDGPSGSGKGTVGKLLAEKLGWHFLDSGAVYRVLALKIIRNKIQLNDVDILVAKIKEFKIKFIDRVDLPQQVFLDEEDVTVAIRSEECSHIASKIATITEVRNALTILFQKFVELPGLVADGRDMGMVVFPKAKLKIFLTADVEARAKRRLLQLQAQGINATLDAVLQGLIDRDVRDKCRAISPLKPDPAAVVIDTTKLSIDKVLQIILEHIK